MKEFLESLFETSSERIKNPFIGSYITAFLVYNWRPIFLLIFSDAKIEDKIVVINYEYCPKEAILWPLAIALFYILILPYINLLFDYMLSFSNSKKDERKKTNILSNLKHKKAEAKYEREIAEERAGTSEVSQLKDQIERLNIENKKLSDQNSETFNRYNKSIEISKKNENDLNSKLEKLEIENKDLDNELYKIKNNNLIYSISDKLTNSQKLYFIQYSDFKLRRIKSVAKNVNDLEKFVKLGLLEENGKSKNAEEHILTEIGKELNNYLKTQNIN